MLMLFIVLSSLFAPASAARAKAVLASQGTGKTVGVVTFDETPGQNAVLIRGFLTDLSPGLHGFHIHTLGDLESGCGGAGGHFNPRRVSHGAPTDRVRHVGDLGNIRADASGVANISITDRGFSLFGPLSVMGRTLMVHSRADDLGKGRTAESRKTGSAGSRVACGLIGVASENFQMCPFAQPVGLVRPSSTVHGRLGLRGRPLRPPTYVNPGFPPPPPSIVTRPYGGRSTGVRRKSGHKTAAFNRSAWDALG